MGKRQFSIPTDEDVQSLSSKSKFVIPTDEDVSSIVKPVKKKDVTVSSGQIPSTVGKSEPVQQEEEDDSWLITKLLKGGAKAIYNTAIDAVESLARFSSASGSMGVGAPSQYLTQDVRGEKRAKDTTQKQRLEQTEKDITPFFESIKFTPKGSADIFTEEGLRIPDAEAVGYQIGDGLAQLGLNVFGGGLGIAANFLASTEKKYKESRAQGISADRALVESSVRSSAETLMDKYIGVERLLGKGAAKVVTKGAISQLAKKELTKEAFQKGVAQSISLFSTEGAKQVGKGFGLEAVDEFAQTYSDEGIKTLFNMYQEAKKSNDPNAKIKLYDADLGSGKTLVGALNSGFYGGLTGAMGAKYSMSRSFVPTIYSSLQNAYDAGGVQELNNSKALVEKGINEAFQSKKMNESQYNSALNNLNNIQSDIQSYSQNSTADSHTRFQKFEIENTHIPSAVGRITESLTEQLAPTITANEADIEMDKQNGRFVEMSFTSRENTPDEFIPFLKDEKVEINGQEVVQAQVPASIAQAFEQNKQNKESVAQTIATAIGETSENSSNLTFDSLISRIKATIPDQRAKEAFGLEAINSKDAISSDIRLMNFLKESKNEIAKSGQFDIEGYNKGIENVLLAKEGATVQYENQERKIESVSTNGQQVKLQGIDEQVNVSDVTPVVAKDNAPSAVQMAEGDVVQESTQQEEQIQEVAPQEDADALIDVKSTTKALDDNKISQIEDKSGMLFPKNEDTASLIAERYHESKVNNTNPELVSAVEDVLLNKGQPSQEIITETQTPINQQEDEQQKTSGIEQVSRANDSVSQVIPAKAEKPKGRITERALKVEDFSPRAMALKYFIAGGKVLRDVPKNYIGNKLNTLTSLFSRKGASAYISAKSELDARRGLSATQEQGGLTIDAIAQKLWENQDEGVRNYSTSDFQSAVEEALLGFNNKTAMAQDLLEGYSLTPNNLEGQWMEFEASQMGMSVEEFMDYLDSNPNARNAADLTLEEIESALQDEQSFNELIDRADLTQEERDELTNFFAESISKEQSIEDNRPINPALPPVPPTPPTDQELADNPENEPIPQGEIDLTVLSREQTEEMSKELKGKEKITWQKTLELLYDSDIALRKALERAAGKKSFVASLLRNRKGLQGVMNQTLIKATEKIYRGLDEVGMRRFNSLVYARNVIQKDEDRIKAQGKEVKRLTKEHNDKRDNLIEKLTKEYKKQKGVAPDNDAKQKINDKAFAKFPVIDNELSAEFKKKAEEAFPILNHGTIKLGNKEVPMTSKIAEATIESIKESLGSEYAKMEQRVEDFKKFGNDTLKIGLDYGMITQEFYDERKDDFYALRATLERLFENFSDTDKVIYKSASDKAFGVLSKEGTTKVMITDTPLLMQTAYNMMMKASKMNELKSEIYKATVAQGKEADLFQEAEVETYTDEDGEEVVRQNEKGDIVVKGKVPKGFELVSFKENGRAKYFYMKEGLNATMYNLSNTFGNSAVDVTGVVELTNVRNLGNRILTGFATRYEPMFFISNAQMDIAQQIIFTDIWDKGKTYSNLASSTMRALLRSAKFIDVLGRNKDIVAKTLERATELGITMDLMSLSSETRKTIKEGAEINLFKEETVAQKVKSNIVKGVQYFNTKFELGMRLAAFEEVRVNLMQEFKDKNNRVPNEREQYEIDTIAVAQARAYTDFAQKGTLTPKLNLPYLTSSISAFGAAMEYAGNNKKQLAFKVAQLASTGVVAQLASLAIMGMVGDPEDWENVKDYDKNKNILIPVGYKTEKDKYGKEKGRWAFAPIRVNPTLIPTWVASRKTAEAIYYNLMGIKKKESTGLEKIDTFVDAINEALPVAIPVPTSKEKFVKRLGQTISRDLILSASFKGFTGYDPYRGEDLLTYEDKRGELGAEGLANKGIPYVYKAIGEKSGVVSPARTKAVAETFITSGHSFVKLAYAITSEVASAMTGEKNPTIRGESGFTSIPMLKNLAKDVAGRRVLITSDVNYSANKEIQENYNKAEELSRKYLTEKNRLTIELKDLRKSSKNEEDFLNKVETQIIPKLKKESKDIYEELDVLDEAYKIADKSITRDLLSPKEYDDAAVIKMTQTPKGQAEMLYYMYENDVKKAERTLEKANTLGLKDSFRVLEEYKKLIKTKKN
jgi:hypothetical protein